MFRFTQEPSSGSYNQCLAKITSLVQQCVLVLTLSVLWWHILTWCACVRMVHCALHNYKCVCVRAYGSLCFAQ